MGHYRIVKSEVREEIVEMDLGRETAITLSVFRETLVHALYRLGVKEIFAADAQDPLGFAMMKDEGEKHLTAAIHHIDEAMAAVAGFLRWLESVKTE